MTKAAWGIFCRQRFAMNESILKILDINRDAIATNRGYYYQYLCLLKKWISNYVHDIDALTYSEVGEDIKEVGSKLVFTQVKCYSKTFSLNSKEIAKALFGFFIHYLKESPDFPDLKFVFETNSSISRNEKLLAKWIAQQPTPDPTLIEFYCEKIEAVLLAEIKKVRRDRLSAQTLTGEKKTEINYAFNFLKDRLTPELLRKFSLSILWEFSGESPEEGIRSAYAEIRGLLKHERFRGKPVDLLIDVFLSEIYRCSQNKNKEDRALSAATISSLLEKTEKDLNQFINEKLLSLLNSRFDSIYNAIDELQQVQLNQGTRIEELFTRLDSSEQCSMQAKDLTLIPHVYPQDIIGREPELNELRELLSNYKHLSIHGTGGLGKTTLAKLFLHQYRREFNHVLWLNAFTGLKEAIAFNNELKNNLKLVFEKTDDLDTRFTHVVNQLNKLPGINLIIIDNYEGSYADLNPILSLSNWRVLITTRAIIKSIPAFKVNRLSFANATLLYRKSDTTLTIDDNQLKEFFDLIDYNTLIIEITSKTIAKSIDLTLEKVVDYLKNQELDDAELEIDVEIGGEDNYVRLYAHLLNTFKHKNLPGDESNFLELLALLPSEDTRITELIEWCGKDFEAKNKPYFTNIVNSLQAKGWIERSGDVIKIHRMIQDIIIYEQRSVLSPFAGKSLFFGWLGHRFKEGFLGDPTLSFRLLKYGESILRAIKEPYRYAVYQPLLIIENEVLNIYNWLIIEEDLVKRWESLCQRATKYLKKEDELLGAIFNNYGLALAANQQVDKALNLFDRSLTILKKYKTKATATQLLNVYNNLSMAMIVTRNYAEFGKYLRESIKVRNEYSLFDDQTISLQCNTLGIANQHAGNIEKAIEFFELAVTEHQKINAKQRNDMNLVLFLNNLAYNLFISGKQEKATDCLNKALQVLEKFNVEDNKMLIVITQTLIWMLEEMGEVDKAETLKRTFNKN